MKHVLLIFSAIITLFGCTSNQKNIIRISSLKNALVFPIDSLTSSYSNGVGYFEDNEMELFFNLNWNTNTLQVYNLEENNLLQKIKLIKTGPAAHGDVFGFWVNNLDSVYLFSQMNSIIVHSNLDGVIANRINYTSPDNYSTAFQHNAYFKSNPIFLNDSVLLVKSHLQGNYRNMTDATLEKSPLSYTINLHNGTTKVLPIYYPEDYLNKGLKFFEYSMAADEDKIVFSFFGDHQLYYTDRTSPQKLQSKNGKSNFFPQEMPLFPEGGREATYSYLFAGERYESLLYDKYRKLYYRIAMHKVDVENEQQLRELKRSPGPFSVMVYNYNLELIAEKKMTENRYLPSLLFVGKDGLYISANHPENPENKEDEMVFDLLSLDELK